MAKPTFSFSKKEETISNSAELEREESKNSVTIDAPIYTHDALGTWRDDSTGEWMVAVVRYNPITKQAAVVENIHSGGSKEFAIDKFKIQAVQKGIAR